MWEADVSDLIGVTEAARILDLDESRVRRLIRAGKLAAQQIGRSHVLDRAEVRRFSRITRKPGRPAKE